VRRRARAIYQLFQATYQEWPDDRAARLTAGLAYYTVFSLAPLLIITLAVAGVLFDASAARGAVLQEVRAHRAARPRQRAARHRHAVQAALSDPARASYRYTSAERADQEQRSEVVVEYHFPKNWIFEGAYGDHGEGSADLLWSKRY